MSKKLTSSLVKVLVLIAAVVAMVLAIPSSVIPTNMNDVIVNDQNENNKNSSNGYSSDKNSSDFISGENVNALTNSILLNDLDDDSNSTSLLTDTNTGTNNTNKNNQSNNSNNNSQGTGGGSSTNNNKDNLLSDNNNHYVEGDSTESTDETPLKFFDVTLFNYNTNAINNATKVIDKAGVDKEYYDGIYFRNSTNLTDENVIYGYYNPTYDSSGNAIVENGKYIIRNIRSGQFLTGDTDSIDGRTVNSEATIWTVTQVDGGYHIRNESGQYLNVGNGTGNCKLSSTSQAIKMIKYKSEERVVQIGYNGKYLNQWSGGASTTYGGHDAGDGGNRMYLIKVDYVTPEFDNNGNANLDDGYYYIVNERSGKYIQGSSISLSEASSLSDATPWKLTKNSDGTYVIQNQEGNYFNIGNTSGSTSGTLVSSNAQNITIRKYTGTGDNAAALPEIAITLANGSFYLNDHQGSDNTVFAAYNQVDKGNILYLYKAVEDTNATVPKNYEPKFNNNVATVEPGQYYIFNKRRNVYANGTSSSIDEVPSASQATLWNVTGNATDGYTFTDQSGNYLNIASANQVTNCGVSTTAQTFKITKYTHTNKDDYTVMIGKADGYYLSEIFGTGNTDLGSYDVANDEGNAMYLKRVVTAVPLDLNYGSRTVEYAPWNKWTGGQDIANKKSYAGYTYDGLVENQLDSNGNIVFKIPEAGIFDETDTSTKDIYTMVGLPFRQVNGFYVFDALQDSARFVGGAESNKRLTFNDQPQKYRENFSTGDAANRDAGFFPFDDAGILADDRITNPTYHFGMKLEVFFYVTPTGTSVVDGSDIEFNFAGDDDVWVYIDDQLVLDMGGIHDSVDGNINFAKNTASVKSTKEQYSSGYFDANDGNPYDSNGNLIKTETAGIGENPEPLKLFNDDEGNGILNQRMEDFTNLNMHKMTIYYLERGSSESNFEMGFNLPLNDTVSVNKNITHSKTADGETHPLTDAEQAMVDNLDYTFVLYRDGIPASNYAYRLLDANLNFIGAGTTDPNGEFTIKNNQIASFVDDIGIGDLGHTYYAVEKELEGFYEPDYSMAHRGAGYINRKTGTGWTTEEFEVEGLTTYMDNVSFSFTNYLKADVPNPSVFTNIDQYVLDFGITADLGNVLTNDVYKGDSIELTSVYCPANGNNTSVGQYGTFTWDASGNVTYTLDKQLTKPEVLEYTVTVSTEGEDSVTGTGTIYIMPATSIYYEDDFLGLISFKVANGVDPWVQVGTKDGNIQESGLVGTIDDSPYGSDASYLDDSEDSNGTSYYVNTTNGAAQFTYTFSGTGTSFFARTSNTTGTMRVRIKDKDGKVIYELMRDTSYKTDDDDTTLYNIPVFTYHADAYGTYTVEVTIAKKTVNNKTGVVVNHHEFYLDGITVFNPLDTSFNSSSELALVEMTLSAYATDGEANNTVATLRDKIITDYISDDGQNWSGDRFVIFTDSDGEILLGGDGTEGSDEANIYVSDGPKEEVYMVDGQQMRFALNGLDTNTHKVYLGLKAPMCSAKVLINGNEITINNAKECYYDITRFVTIYEDANGNLVPVFTIEADASEGLGLISVTNIRVTGNVEFAIAPDVNK